MDMKKVRFYYDSCYQKRVVKDSNTIVSFYSKDTISEEEYKKLKEDFLNYLENEKSDDIIEVTSKIKEIFKNLKENKLEISIRLKDYIQKVTFINGIIEDCSFSITCWNDIVEVSTHHNNVSVQFKKENTEFTKQSIYNKIDYFIDKILELRKLEKKENNKTYKK